MAGDDAIAARETVAKPDMGAIIGETIVAADVASVACPGADKSRPAARRRAPSLKAAPAVGIMEDTDAPDAGDVVVPGLEYALSIPRLTILSHLRLSCKSSASCVVNWDRSSRHFASFCAINCKSSACFSVNVRGP